MKCSGESSCVCDVWRISRLYFVFLKYVIAQPFQRKIELREPQQVLRQTLGDDLEVLDFSTEPLVKWGDNYASTIVKADLEVKTHDRVEKLHLVAKMLPLTEFQRKIMHYEVSMSKEIFFYEQIVPAYQKIHGSDFDIVPKFYGGRLAIKPDVAGIDEGAVLLIENLKASGFVMEDRLKGLTKDHLKVAVPAIARFHAIGLAIKIKNPAFFAKIKNYRKPTEISPAMLNLYLTKSMKMIKNNRELSKYYKRIKSLRRFDSNGNYLFFEDLDPEHPWVCLVHSDLWMNNVMFHSNEGKVDGFKFFDFQNYGLLSPMTDLLYFLFTSLQREFEDFEYALKLYRKIARDTLEELGCDASLFEEESFEKRLKEDAKTELYHCLMTARNIETRSAWDMVRLTANGVRRLRRIFEIYDAKGWF